MSDYSTANNPAAKPPVYQVSELVNEIRRLLESSYRECWVEAELSRLTRHGSGHWYFTLKDANAQISCAMFRNRASLNRYIPKEGDKVRVHAKVSVYTVRGDMQLIVQHMEPAGEGLLKQQYEALKLQLEQEGLFAVERKQALPKLPKRIGLITSPSGAAIQDVLTTLERRFPAIPVVLYASRVQGQEAVPDLLQALQLAVQDARCDVLVITRGGGSLEDLWCFNDETLVRAVANCPLPIVSAVGHEIDVTLCDFAADMRAPTPTAAAELVSPDSAHYQARLNDLQQRLSQAQQQGLQRRGQQLDWLSARLPRPDKMLAGREQRLQELLQRLTFAQQRRRQRLTEKTEWLAARLVHPQQMLTERKQRLQELATRLRTPLPRSLQQQQYRLQQLNTRLHTQHPKPAVQRLQQQVTQLQSRLQQQISLQLDKDKRRLDYQGQQLHAVSPLATLSRGYTIAAQSSELTDIVKSADDLQNGDVVYLKFHRGGASCKVIETHDD